jgi:phosphodiesterase/alkaline phosphatase D-like protein
MRHALLITCIFASFAAAEDAPRLTWAWAGGVSDRAAVVVGRVTAPTRLLIAEASTWASSRTAADAAPLAGDADGIVRTAASGLKADTVYAYGDRDVEAPYGTFRTLPEPGRPAGFAIALGSCLGDPEAPTFRAIARQKPLFMLLTGDLHYEDIADNDPKRFFAAITSRPAAASFGAMMRVTPITYVWDDHDFCGNDSNGLARGAEAAHVSFRRLVPSHDLALPGAATPIARAFTVGRVRFIIPDLRSQRDVVPGSLLGAAQRTWIDAELHSAAKTHALAVLVSSVPWNGQPVTGKDRWQSYADERAWLAGRMKDAGIRTCVVAGDAHMCAIDDGSNADFAPGWPTPVFQAAALARTGSYKGGLYNHGANPQTLQFGWMQVTDDGKQLTVRWEARDGSDGEGSRIVTATRDRVGEPIFYSFTVATP